MLVYSGQPRKKARQVSWCKIHPCFLAKVSKKEGKKSGRRWKMLNSTKATLLSLILIISLVGSTRVYPHITGDLDGNHIVDLKDLRTLTWQWLDPNCLAPGCIADLDGVNGVNMADFAILANNWQIVESYLVISEFMASNSNTILDGDGQSSDWIEIYNPTGKTVNLDGWYLTNSRDNLNLWQFPDGLQVEPGQFLIVFASDKTRQLYPNNYPYLDPAGYYHTNFNLDKDFGDYLALVAADNNDVVHEYSPQFPAQLTDISYGLVQHATTLIPTVATAAYQVPTSEDAALDWTNPGFCDSEWHQGQTALGFGAALEETGQDIGSPATAGSYSVVNGVYTIEGDGEGIWSGPITTGDDFYYVYTPLGGDGEITARITGLEYTNNWAMAGVMIREDLTDISSHAMMIVTPPEGQDTYAFQWVDGIDRDNSFQAGDVTLPSWVRIERTGDVFTGYYAPDEGGVPEAADWIKQGTVSIPMAEDVYIGLCVTSHSDGTLCTAVFDNLDHPGQISTDIRDHMLGINTSLWTRINFYVDEPDFYDCLTLRMKYEDGYIAYLNGVEIAKKNFSGIPAWNSMADDDRPDQQSSEFEDINLNKFLDLLQPSPQKNVLAVQALNDNISNEEFLILPELVVAKNEEVPQYFTKPTPGTFNIAGAMGIVSEVWFSHERGFYDDSFQLILSTADSDAVIHYTLDGSRPTITHGITYSGPIDINDTSTIRAVAVKPGWLDSMIKTHTYIFTADVRYQSLYGEPPGPNWPAPGYFNAQRIDYGMDPKVVIDDPRYSGQTIIDALEAIPTVSIATDLDNLFSPSKGIYVNAYNEGRAWERPCSVELIYPPNPQGPGFPDLIRLPDANGVWRWVLPRDMKGGSQADAGVRIRGGFSASGENPKHAFRLFFRSEYGDAKLRYPMFGDEGDDVFDHIDLRCSQNYSWAFQGDNKNSMVREVFSRDLQGRMGHPYTRSRYYHLYINGHYWGLFQTQERSEASWGQSYMGGEKDDYDVLTSDRTADRRVVPTDGERDAYDRLYDETIAGFHDYERYSRVQGLNIDGTPNDTFERLLDVENLIDFMIIEYYTGDSDGPGSRFGGVPNNTWGIFNRVNPDGWKWTHHDNEHTLGAGGAGPPPGAAVENLVEPFTSAGGNRDFFNPHWLHEQLMLSNIDYRLKFADHVHRHFHNDGLMTLEVSRNNILNRTYQIDMAIIAESARWGDAKHSYWAHNKDDHWWPEINRLLYETFDPWGGQTYLTPRVDIVLQQFKDVGWYPNAQPPVFANMNEYVFLGNPNGAGTIYYTTDGNDPRLPAAQSLPGPPVTLLAESAAKSYLVPTVANGGNLLSNTPARFDITYYKANIAVVNLATAESIISNPSYQSQVITETSSVINYNNTYCPGHFTNDNPIPGGSGDLDDYVIEANAVVLIPSADNWTFGVYSDAGFSLELTGPDSFYMEYPSLRAADDSFAVFNVTTPGAYNLRLVYFERGGWSGVELFAAQGSHTSFNSNFRLIGDMANGGLQVGEPNVWSAPYFDNSSWPDGTGGIGYEKNQTGDPNYTGLFNIDVEAQMYDDGGNPSANTSCYIRIPFTAGSTELTDLTLKIRYDDGFIAYLNGIEVARRNFTRTPQWDSNSTVQNPDSSALNFESIPITSHIRTLRLGSNLLAIHGLNISTTDSDFLISAELVANEINQGDVSTYALTYGSYLTLNKSTLLKSRILYNGIWSPLNEKIYPIGPVRENLRITEIMYHPQDTNDPNEEFIELKNIGEETINLNLVRFTNGIDFTFPPINLESGHYVIVVQNRSAFETKHPGLSGLIAGHYSGRLSNAGERIGLVDAIGRVIHNFTYSDTWRNITDGQGFSLTLIDPAQPDPNKWSEKDYWRASAYVGGSPGGHDNGIIPNPGAIVINEAMSHSNNGPDWIELHNTTGEPLDIGGWFLSDNDANLMKYRIADGTTIYENDYIVFYQDANFNNPEDPGCIIPFILSENGEELCLSSHLDPNGILTGYRDVENFGAAQTNVSFGRYFKSSTGNFNFVAMDYNTPDVNNAYPKVGPIVINEIMYNPPTGNQNQEYIELHNITGLPVTLFRMEKYTPWKFTDGIDYTFSATSFATIPPGGYLMVVKDKTDFEARYGIMPFGVDVVDGYDGWLSNAGERLQIAMPGDIDEFGTRYYIRIDRVTYSDGSHPEDCPGGVDNWPTGADGGGKSLSRKVPSDYGNDVANWKAAEPSPGLPNP
jgi:hypothetical protein